MDAETLLPGLFSRRRIAVASAGAPGVPEAAIASALKGDTLSVRGDRAGARAAYEAATAQAPQLAGAQLQLAMLLDQMGQIDGAIERYRRAIS